MLIITTPNKRLVKTTKETKKTTKKTGSGINSTGVKKDSKTVIVKDSLKYDENAQGNSSVATVSHKDCRRKLSKSAIAKCRLKSIDTTGMSQECKMFASRIYKLTKIVALELGDISDSDLEALNVT